MSLAPRHCVEQSQIDVDDRSFRQLAGIVQAESGIVLNENKRSLLASRLGRRLRELGLGDFGTYCQYLESEKGPSERRRMTSLLTTNVTRFFREPHHFDALENHVLPPLVARAKSGGRVRIWSAGCSSGQEPYSISTTLLKLLPEAGRYDVRILGTDIDPEMIRVGRNGVYRDVDESQMPADTRNQLFGKTRTSNKSWQVAPDVKNLVTLTELNLMKDWPMRGLFDVIFCRNVVIYFDASAQAKLWARFAAAMHPGGHLFVGHSERVAGPAEAEFAAAGFTQYRRC